MRRQKKKQTNKKKKLNISLDKLDQEQLKALRERTGKTDRELLKLALQSLHRELCEEKEEQQIPLFNPFYVPPITFTEPVGPAPVDPFAPVKIIPTTPIIPGPNTVPPYPPNTTADPIYMSPPSTTCYDIDNDIVITNETTIQ